MNQWADCAVAQVNGNNSKDWEVKNRSEPYGSPLCIRVPGGVERGKIVALEIALQTTKKCSALQFFTPTQTSNKKFPYSKYMTIKQSYKSYESI